MLKFSDGIEIKAGNISMVTKGGIATYELYGYVYREDSPNGEYVILQPEDLRKNPVAKFPIEKIASLIVRW